MGERVDVAMIAIDFFCGGGGLTKGLANAGIKILGGYDICQNYKTTYETNNKCKFLCKDVRALDKPVIYSDFPEIAGNEDNLLLSGCAPCQPFSSQRRSNKEHIDVSLLEEFGRIVDIVKPAHIIVENVPGLRGKGEKVLRLFIEVLSRNDYFYAFRVVNAKDYGVPQNRNRLVIIASRFFLPIIPKGSHGPEKLPYTTVREAIGSYPHLEAGTSCDTLPNHAASLLSEINMERIMATPASGGDRRSWPDYLILKCHKKGYSGHTDVYGRMAWDKVSPTLTAKCYSLSNGRYGHPEQNRAISLREAAAIQSFEDDYIFYGNTMSIGRQIGNAVPVKLAEALARYIVRMSRNSILEDD
jgi:DNA (cytosine-5)-methyltransferase 1